MLNFNFKSEKRNTKTVQKLHLLVMHWPSLLWVQAGLLEQRIGPTIVAKSMILLECDLEVIKL